MKSIYTITMVGLLGACQSHTKPNPIQPTETVQQVDTTTKPTIPITPAKHASHELELPRIGSFELSQMKKESVHTYGAGDCRGNITKYSLPAKALAIDSMSCGEYGYAYTYYLLNEQDSIQAVYSKESEMMYNPEVASYNYIREEQLIDFKGTIAMSMIRTDTIADYHLREERIAKEFTDAPVTDKQTVYNQWMLKYLKTWEMEQSNE
ncbi:hypothetical protein SAMN05216480_10466 [Pustulibacterium marinum]|uniref:Lipoprotein n=1 Tax=Pustulibacterium marinum TaxID=1224947 RepID=A0A1I7GBG7_9FLAO|nr:hypothetical protein [Pustulibacterium marinum]SFU45783.1 hypothetical protein SAMN05216480_10466 [Pustulibacterium marinum]